MAYPIMDLDELVLLCRSDRARQYIAEAVGCYRGGAYRATIVSTWIAVVFDILDKLRELDLSGDANARAKLGEFEKNREADNRKKLLELERGILEVAAKEFELLAAIEYEELVRLHDDRNRCAHPSMISDEDPYRPSAELARSHMRNAVVYLLSRQPVQGKAAHNRIMQDISSQYFPTDPSAAMARLADGPLARARAPLVRSLVVSIARHLMHERVSYSVRAREIAAMSAMLELNRQICEDALRETLPGIIDGVEDKDWRRVIWLIGGLPVTWDLISNAHRDKANQFVMEVEEDEEAALVVADALKIPYLSEVARNRLQILSTPNITMLLQSDPSPELAEVAIQRFANADSFREARNSGNNLLVPAIDHLTEDSARIALQAFRDNSQINGATGMPTIYLNLLERTGHLSHLLTEEWEQVHAKLSSKKPDSEEGQLRTRIEEVVLNRSSVEATI
jgi:hypothetical protein